MKENDRLKKLFRDHFDGNPWIDVSILPSLKGLNAPAAAKNMEGFNSIWQIVHHMTCWRETMLERLRGKPIPSPADNYFVPVTDISPKAWTKAVSRLRVSQRSLLAYLSEEPGAMDEKPGNQVYTRYELIQGLLQHDAYHLGQIILLKKLLGRK